MVHQDSDDHVRRQLRTLQRVAGNPSDAVLARRAGVAAATFSEVMSGKRRPREQFVVKVVAGCLVCARAGGQAPLDEQRVLHALRLPGFTAADGGILERDGELDRCSAVLDAVRTRGGATVVVEGPGGIGKSELLARVCAEAAVRGVVPLAVRGNQRDQTMAFGAVRTLLARWVTGHGSAEQRALFAGAAGLARIPLGMPHTPPRGPGTMIGLTEALYWLVVNATSLVRSGRQEKALLFAVDDAHWLDEESLNWCEFVSDRLAGLPLVLLLAYRPHESRSAPVLARIAVRAAEIVRLRALSHDAVSTLVSHSVARHRYRHGPVQPPDEQFCTAFVQRSGGNPFYLRWLLDLARERGLPATATAAEEVSKLTPQHVVVYLNERLAGLGPSARRLSQTIAVLGPGCSLERAARLAELPLSEAKREYDRLCNTAILAPGPNLDFCHPIIRSAVYDDIGPSLRSDTHLAAARLIHHEHGDPEAVAAHLLDVHAAASPWVVDRLGAAAEEAMASGLSSTAARYLKRAVEEPPPSASRCRVLLRYGQALALGKVTLALPELLAAYQQAPEEVLRTDAAVALAKTYGYADQLGDSVRVLGTAIDQCADQRSRERLVTEQLLWATWWAQDPRRVDRMRLLDQITPPLAGDTHRQRLLIVLWAWSLVLRGEPRSAALAAIRPVIERGVVFTDFEQGMEVATMTAFVHLYSDELAIADALFHQAVGEFHRDGWRGTHLAFAHAHLGNVALRQGRLADAVTDADIALRLADRAGQGTPAGWFATGTLIEALLARGDIDRATELCAHRSYGTHQPDALTLPLAQAVFGALLLAKHNIPQAITTLRRVGQWLEETHLANPSWCPWRFDLARALRQSAPHEADEIASVAQRQADRFGCRSARGRATRTLATLRPASAIELLKESTDILRDTPYRWEYVQTLAELGTVLRRTGRSDDARKTLTEAQWLADECDAPSLRTTINQQLALMATTPSVPPRANSLHPHQRRIAQLAAQGHSNAEISHQMVLNLDTVTTLLRDAQKKLKATSPTELRRALNRSGT